MNNSEKRLLSQRVHNDADLKARMRNHVDVEAKLYDRFRAFGVVLLLMAIGDLHVRTQAVGASAPEITGPLDFLEGAAAMGAAALLVRIVASYRIEALGRRLGYLQPVIEQEAVEPWGSSELVEHWESVKAMLNPELPLEAGQL